MVEQLIQMLKREVREQAQDENYTTSFAQNDKVGTDSLSPSIHWFPGYYLQYLPTISTFCGKEAPGKNEVSFEQWLVEIRSVQGLYSKPVLREAVIKSLKGTTADLVRSMRSLVEVKGIISKL